VVSRALGSTDWAQEYAERKRSLSQEAEIAAGTKGGRDRLEGPVLCKNSDDRLGGPPFIVVEDPAQPFMTHNGGIHVDDAWLFLDQPIVEPLMIPLNVVVLRVFLHSMA
jgi:hypothetical protein